MAENKPLRQLVRIANTDLAGDGALYHSLRKIKGVSFMYANMVCSVAKIPKSAKVGELSDEQIKVINDIIKNPLKHNAPSWIINRRKDYETGEDMHLITSDLDFSKENDIKRLKKNKIYRGIRHMFGLPCRGQRTKSNFRRNKGKISLGVQRKKTKAGRV